MAGPRRSGRRQAPERANTADSTVGGNAVEPEVNAADVAADNVGVNAAGGAANHAGVAAGNAADGVEQAAGNAAGAVPNGLEAVLGLLAQVLERLPAVAPAPVVPPAEPRVVVDPVGNGIGGGVEQVERVPTYLEALDHMGRLGTKFFSGGSLPIEADEWRMRLERNFESIRCPEGYKKDIAVHYLEGSAHTWWKSVAGRLVNPGCSFETFSAMFRSKYFPQEAYNRLEAAFLYLRQGSMTVREYETEFNSLRKYVGREFDSEEKLIHRFMAGLRVELRNGCLVRDYTTVAELVEKAALLESGQQEEALEKAETVVPVPKSGRSSGGGQNRKYGKTGPGKSTAGRSTCGACGKVHVGDCRHASGACLRCGSLGHRVRDCPEPDPRTGKGSVSEAGTRVCYGCGEPGHFRRDCPKASVAEQATVQQKRAGEGLAPAAKRQAIMPRLYTAVADETGEPSASRPITGEF